MIENSGEDDLMFLVKPLKHSGYSISPRAGIVRSYSSVEVRVQLKNKEGSKRDKFFIRFALVEEQLAFL